MPTECWFTRTPDGKRLGGPYLLPQILNMWVTAKIGPDWDILVCHPLKFGQYKRSQRWKKAGGIFTEVQEKPRDAPHGPRVDFTCVNCSGNVGIHPADGNQACPRCGAGYRVMPVEGQHPVFVVVPLSAMASARAARRPAKPSLRSALMLLQLPEVATMEKVSQAYRELIKLYHPDKVAHLGPELRQLAESKTKEINAAYRLIESQLQR